MINNPVNFVSISEDLPVPKKDDGAVVGIDFGTTYSCVALAHDGVVDTLPLGKAAHGLTGLIDTRVFPSIAFDQWPDSRGFAKDSAILPITRFKPLLDKEDQKISEDIDPETWTYLFLRFLKQECEAYLRQPICSAVLTVPAKFSHHGRSALQRAAEKAGIKVIRLLNEPTAAAIAYGFHPGIILVYDFGGGTFDATILRFEQGVFQVLASGGLILGGNDIDQALVQLLHWTNPNDLEKARRLKESFSYPNFASELITRADFNLLVQGFVDRTISVIENLLLDLQLTPQEVRQVLFVGGSSRLDQVSASLSKMFGTEALRKDIDPERAVSIGAALHAEALTHQGLVSGQIAGQPAGQTAGQTSRPLLLDIVPSSLGIETAMGCVETVIPRYTPTPFSRTLNLSTFFDNQTDVLIHIVQGDQTLVQNCRSLGKFVLHGIEPMPGGKPEIQVTFSVDDNGILSVTASEKLSHTEKTLQIDYVSAV